MARSRRKRDEPMTEKTAKKLRKEMRRARLEERREERYPDMASRLFPPGTTTGANADGPGRTPFPEGS